MDTNIYQLNKIIEEVIGNNELYLYEDGGTVYLCDPNNVEEMADDELSEDNIREIATSWLKAVS